MTTSCARSRASSLVRIWLPGSAEEQAHVPALQAAGYVLRAREPGWSGHRLCTGPDAGISLHVFTAAAAQTGRMLLLRDWLRASDVDRAAYLQVKRDLAGRTWRHVQHYADARTAIVEQVIARDPAPAWATPRLARHAPRPSWRWDGRSETPD
jgi:GrpB-like predicted nucleotidyltransferase (UPF0157 family)